MPLTKPNNITAIGVCGTQRCGKTTTIANYRLRSDIIIVRETAADLINANYETIVQEPRFQWMVFAEQYRRLQAAFRQGANKHAQVIIADRFELDNYVYIALNRELNPHFRLPEPPEWRIRAMMHPFDVVFLLSPADISSFRNIAWKSSDPTFELYLRNRVDELYYDVAAELGITIVPLSGTVEERVRVIDAVIEGSTDIRFNREHVIVDPEGTTRPIEGGF